MDTPREVSTVFSRAPAGLEAPMVRVEVHLGTGLPAFNLGAQQGGGVRQRKERWPRARVTDGDDSSKLRITVDRSPGDLPNEGGRFDLPIAVGILAADSQILPPALRCR